MAIENDVTIRHGGVAFVGFLSLRRDKDT